MPVVATPASPIILTVDAVRVFTRDMPNKNPLLEDIQFTQSEINQGVKMVTSAYNVTTPLTAIPIQGWPVGQEYLLLLGVAWYLALSEAQRQLRNQLTYQDGDIAPVGLDDKYSLYMNLYSTLKSDWDQLTKNAKIQRNLEGAYGNLASGYLNVGRYNRG